MPALIWLCGFEPSKAAGTSLAFLVPPIGLPAAWKYFVEKRIDLDNVRTAAPQALQVQLNEAESRLATLRGTAMSSSSSDAERRLSKLEEENAVATARKLAPTRIFLGGQSYGGRQATMLCAETPDLADGLLLLSYPLHAPGKPDQPRIQHLHKLQLPCLFVHGTRDPFGSLEEMQSALKLIPSRTELLPVEGAGHDLGFKGKSKNEELPNKVTEAFHRFFETP